MFDPVSTKVNFPESEQHVLKFWETHRIYEKSLENRKAGKSFVFFEGPPTANGLPHPGHCLTRVMKDVFPRYFTMRGYRCERKAGWDTHGLPVEIEVGKELGLHSKDDIEAYGVEPFVQKCVQSVFRYTKEWEDLTKRLGFWVNLEDAYVTYHQSYVETVWWCLSKLFEKGLLYQGHKVIWWWPQGGTALSSGEVSEGYKSVDDPSIFVRFELEDPTKLPGVDDNVKTSFLAWTTTPWTLSSNVALAVNEKFQYVVLEYKTDDEHERFVLAEDLIKPTFEGLKLDLENDFQVVSKFKGDQLVGLKYKPIFKYMEPEPLSVSTGVTNDETAAQDLKAWEVALADFVTLDAGTGIVHCAPAFGEDDYKFADANGFGFLQMVQPDGRFRPEATDVAGRMCKEADKDIIKLLKERGVLLKRSVVNHQYPFCPRAENDPLIQYARKSWFIRTTDFKDEFLKNNDAINWLPDHIKEGRFGDFLRNNVDWALSRERYWGTPLPVWQCEKTGFQETVANYDELLQKPDVQGTEFWENAKKANPELPDDLKVHKPYIDHVTYASPKDSSSRMRRVPEVIDCWFDSGAMPVAQWGYPHKGTDKFPTQYPADFISEAQDQTRGWFYTLLAISTMLKDELGAPAEDYPIPFRTCIVLGLMLGEDGTKLSKRKRNYRDPSFLFDSYGVDAMRWMFLSAQPPWSSIRFSEESIKEVQREFLIRLQNVFSFFVLYANIDQFDPSETPRPDPAQRTRLDRWVLSELHQTLKDVTQMMDVYDNYNAANRLNKFVDALSNWYVRLNRSRFWASGVESDKVNAFWTLYECLVTLSKMIAPFVPFFAETMHQNLVRKVFSGSEESVHLCDWPTHDENLTNGDLMAEMELAEEVVSAGRSARTEARLRVRQPLSAVTVLLADRSKNEIVERSKELIADELNVKEVRLGENADQYVDYSVQPNLPRLGPRFGKQLPKIRKALSQMDPTELHNQLEASETFALDLGDETLTLEKDDVMFSLTARPGYAAAEGRQVVVVLSTEVTEDLKIEGNAREIVHALQGMRRELDLERDQRIRVCAQTVAPLTDALEKHADYIKGETLAVELSEKPCPNASDIKTITIEDTDIALTIEKV